jgi:hypothetical protein
MPQDLEHRRIRRLGAKLGAEGRRRACARVRDYERACHSIGIKPESRLLILREALECELLGDGERAGYDTTSRDYARPFQGWDY